MTIGIVTGASAGIGLQTAIGLARAGMRVIMVGRNPARLAVARDDVMAARPDAEIETEIADFSSFAEIRRLAARLLDRHAAIELLVNNAGLTTRRHTLSTDGIETTFAVDHLAPFLLTNLLIPGLIAGAPSRVITVASQAHLGATIDLATIARPRDWRLFRSYKRSKLCNILFTRELARRLAETGVVAVSLHPGVVATKIGQKGPLTGLIWRLGKPFMLSPKQGAATSLFLATTPDPTPFHGAYVIGTEISRVDPAARDDVLARQLWTYSAELAGLRASDTELR